MASSEFPAFTFPSLSSGIPASDSASSKQAAASQIVEDWAHQLNTELLDSDAPNLSSLLHPEAWLRDCLATTWDFRTIKGRAAIVQHFKDHNDKARVQNIQPRKIGTGDLERRYRGALC